MNFPVEIRDRLLAHYDLSEYLVLLIEDGGKIACCYGQKSLMPELSVGTDIRDPLPALLTESLIDEFSIPFYHLSSDKVVDMHLWLASEQSYLIMVSQEQAYQKIQEKQQQALETKLLNLQLQQLSHELKSKQQLLKQANEDKAFLISALSHEMATPLNSIEGHIELLLQQKLPMDQGLNVVMKNCQQLKNIIQSTLKYDQPQSTHNDVTFELKGLLQELKDSMAPLAAFKSLSFVIDCLPNIQIKGHRPQWQQILTNLISNAIKYTQQGGINIQVSIQNKGLILDVIDSGTGISETFQQLLFKAWQREAPKKEEGSGIGLVIAKMLAENAGLTLDLHRSDETGSCFRITVPTFQVFQGHVLLIEDDEDLARLLVYYLENMGATVQHITECPEIRQLSRQHFDLVLTDRQLKQERIDDYMDDLMKLSAQLVILTGNPSPESIRSLLRLGFKQVLSKPISQNQLYNALLTL